MNGSRLFHCEVLQEKTMNEPTLDDQIAAARAYEELHVPALFQQWAVWVLDAARVEPGHRVLDVACGTGILGREARGRVGPTGFVAGVDPDPGMVAVAEELAPTVDWRQGTAESLPYPDQTFDVVVSQFGLMFFTDRHLAVHEMLRVLVPGGTLVAAVWDRLENSAAYLSEVQLLDRIAGEPAADALRAPFSLGDTRELMALFESAGAASVGLTTRTATARFPSVRSMVEADLRGWLPVMGVVLAEEMIQRILEEAEGALSSFVTSEGEVVFDAPGHIITATK
jgi:ubiquinone/menaquinone biosynthesis C-methylase UbiE